LAKSRRLPGVALFRVIAAAHLGSLAIGGKRQPEADGRKHFSGVHFRTLARIFAEHRPKAEGSLELLFFETSHRATGMVFCRVLTKSWKLSGAVLFQVAATGYLGSLAVGVERQPEADGRKHFSGVYLRRLERLFAGD